jgi:hypothetical protein
MNIAKLAAGLLLAGLVAPASAQTVTDDQRCLLLSNMFAKQTTAPENARRIATQSVSFYAGRLDGRADSQSLSAAVRANLAPVDSKAAAAQLTACAQRMERAVNALQTNVRAAAPRPAPKK